MEVQIEFTFDGSTLGGKQLVTFEELYDITNLEEPKKVTEHKEINDEGQTVTIKEVPETPTPETPGTTTKTSNPPKTGDTANASAIIGLHNHPSGNVKPSKEDMIVTRKLQKCGQLLGIELLDHIIVGGTNGKMLSFREEKMLNVTGRMDWER